jgi:hypothetical protein
MLAFERLVRRFRQIVERSGKPGVTVFKVWGSDLAACDAVVNQHEDTASPDAAGAPDEQRTLFQQS